MHRAVLATVLNAVTRYQDRYGRPPTAAGVRGVLDADMVDHLLDLARGSTAAEGGVDLVVKTALLDLAMAGALKPYRDERLGRPIVRWRSHANVLPPLPTPPSTGGPAA
jgi:hypothetical protein